MCCTNIAPHKYCTLIPALHKCCAEIPRKHYLPVFMLMLMLIISGWNLTHSRLRPCWRRTPWPSGLGVGSNIGASIPLPSSHQHHHQYHQYHHQRDYQCYKYLDTGFSQTSEYSLLCTLSRTYKQKSVSVR